MKKRRNMLLVLVLIIGMVIGVLLAAGLYFLTVGDVAWQEYVEEKLVPNVVFITSSLLGIYIMCYPMLAKAKASMRNFEKATDGVCATAEKDKALTQEMKEITLASNELYDGLREMQKNLQDDRRKMHEDFSKLSAVLQIGFCNSKELVEKGYAAEIAKVLKESEEKKEVSDNEQDLES